MARKLWKLMLPFFGFLFLSAYIRSATVDVIYTDYTRLVTTYLENVFSFAPYMGADIFTRMPLSYLQRIVNVLLFGYSTTFDMLLGAFSLSLTAYIIGKYMMERGYSIAAYLLCMLLVFSLNKWEMLTNGSGWIHFLAITLFVAHFYLFDKARDAESGKYRFLFYALPAFTILLTAGPYSVAYTAVLLPAHLWDMGANGFAKKNVRKNLQRMACILLPFSLYMVSRACSVEEHAGATSLSLSQVLQADFWLLPRLFVKSFASMVFAEEWLRDYGVSEFWVFVLAFLVLAAYLSALYVQYRDKVYRRTVFPLLLLLYGLCNHVLVSLSRWIFLKDHYGMSSRYALQYHLGIVGIILSFACMSREAKGLWRRAGWIFAGMFLVGNLFTTAKEMDMAKYRKENFVRIRETALNFGKESDESLKEVFQYHNGARTRQALSLLQEKHLNVFREREEKE